MKRADRRARTERKVKQRIRDWRIGRPTKNEPVPAKGMLAKRHPFDCGHARCPLCRTNKKTHRKDVARKLPPADE